MQRRDALGDGVDEVRPHRLLGVDEHVDDEQRLAALALGRREQPHLDVLRPAAAPRPSPGGSCWRARGSARLRGEDLLLRRARVAVAGDLDLADHHRLVGVGGEAARLAHDLRGERDRGHDRGLLDRHRHEVVAAVDLEVQPEARAAGEKVPTAFSIIVFAVSIPQGPVAARAGRAPRRTAGTSSRSGRAARTSAACESQTASRSPFPTYLLLAPPRRTGAQSYRRQPILQVARDHLRPCPQGRGILAAGEHQRIAAVPVTIASTARAAPSTPPCCWARKIGSATPTRSAPSASAFAAVEAVAHPARGDELHRRAPHAGARAPPPPRSECPTRRTPAPTSAAVPLARSCSTRTQRGAAQARDVEVLHPELGEPAGDLGRDAAAGLLHDQPIAERVHQRLRRSGSRRGSRDRPRAG